MRAEAADILMVAGLGGSEPSHWQGRWAARLKTARFVTQADLARPDRASWRAGVLAAVDAAERPVILVGHGLGAISAVDAALAALGGGIAGALLVTPPDTEDVARALPAMRSFAPLPGDRLPVPALLVASRSDSFCSFARAETLAAAWGAALMDAGDAGHLNAASGHGPWPEGLLLLSRLLRLADAAPASHHPEASEQALSAQKSSTRGERTVGS